MQILLLVALAVALVAVVFALQNIAPVAVAFFGWTFEGSLAIVLFVALIAGVVISLAASAPSIVRDRRALRRLRRRVGELEQDLAGARREIGAPPPPEPDLPDSFDRSGPD